MKFLRSRHFNSMVLIVGLLIIISFLVEFNRKIKGTVEMEMFSYLHEIRDNAIYILKSELEQFQDFIRREARVITLLGDSSDSGLLAELANFPKPKSMLRGHILSTEGKFFASNESSLRQYDPAQFQEPLYNIKGGISNPRLSQTFHKMIVDISAPLFIKAKYFGIFVGSYDLGYIDKLLLNNFLKGDCSIYIATASGEIVSRSSREASQMDFREIVFDIKNVDNIEFVHKSETDGGIGARSYEGECFKYIKDGSTRYVSYAPAGINDWYIAAVSTEKSLSAQIADIRDSALDLTTGVSFIIAGILALFVLNKMKEYRAKQELLKRLAHTDMLTKLYNRFSCEQMINEELKASATGDKHAFLMIDIDGFKHINDYLGHAKGDEILCEFGAFLGDLFAQGGIAGRIGGDEFCVLVKNYGSTDKLTLVSQKICAKLRQTHSADRGEHKEASTSASIGIALFPQDGTTFDELYRNADEALYRSKNTGKDRCSFFSRVKIFE